MNNIVLTFTLAILFTLKSFANDLSGSWTGTRYQYNETKSAYVAEFDYKYDLKQEGNQITGTAFIQSKGGKFAEIAVRGFVEGNKFYFEEYEVLNATRSEGFLWCLKKGVLNIEEKDGKINLSGATPSFAEYYGYECSGGVTQMSKSNITISETEVKAIADKEMNLEKSMNISVYPNPFVETTQLSFTNDKSQEVIIDVVDIQGKLISTMENKMLEAGTYTYTFTPNPSVNTSYYYIRIKAGDKTITKSIQKINQANIDMR